VTVALAGRIETLCELVLHRRVELGVSEEKDRVRVEQTLDPTGKKDQL
jgi:hypothetical protein